MICKNSDHGNTGVKFQCFFQKRPVPWCHWVKLLSDLGVVILSSDNRLDFHLKISSKVSLKIWKYYKIAGNIKQFCDPSSSK